MEIREKTDHTERESRETAAREFEQRYRTLLDINPNPICVHRGGEIMYANPAALKLAGVPHVHQVIGNSIFQFIAPDCRPEIEERIRFMTQTGQAPPVIEITCTWPNGSSSEVEIISTPVPWHRETAIQFILRDITERKRWERKLQESEARFHQLADAMPQIVWMATADGTIDYRNRKFFDQTGLTEEEATSAATIWQLILHPSDVQPANENWTQCVREGKPFEMEYRYRVRGEKGYRWHLGRALPVKNEKGEVVRWFGTCTDIHEQKQTEFDLQRAKESLAEAAKWLERKVDSRTAKLQASIRSMEDFCYSIAHNLRAPVRAMQGFSNALQEDYSSVLDQEGQDYIRRIHRAATTMDSIILDLLSYGRIDHQTLTLRPVCLAEAMVPIIRHFDPDIQHSKGSIEIGDLNFRVVTDEQMMQHVFFNLVSNAITFAKPGESPSVKLWAEDCGDFIRVHVRDDGIGISAEHQKRIFHAFERLHTPDNYPGTGIGLAIARKAVERLNGKISVESEVNRGSCFTVELPKAGSENNKTAGA